MEHWNYRLVKTIDAEGEFLAMHEVHYNADGKPIACTQNPCAIDFAKTPEDIKWTLKMMMKATEKPVLNMEDFE